MAGFSLILILMFFFWPLMLVWGLFSILAVAAAEFVTSPAFPMLLASIVFGVLAAIDVVRILWNWYKAGRSFEFTWKLLVRPLILGGIAFVFFAAMCITTGSMILSWWQTSMATSTTT